MTTMDRLRTLARDRGLSVDVAIETRDPGIEKTMHEFKRGALHSGSKTGKKVTSRKQAIAIGLSKQRRGDAATQMDRIRRKALDRGLVLDAGTSEGARKAAITRKKGGHGDPEWHAQMAETHLQRAKGAGSHSEAARHLNLHTMHSNYAKTAREREHFGK